MSEFHEYRCFLAVAETESFIRAAERLNLTGSAVSKHIATLEKTLGARLFHRTTRSVKLTDIGEEFANKISQAMGLISEARDSVAKSENIPYGQLTISCAMSLGHQCLLPFFSEFANTYPSMELDLRLEDKYIDLYHDNVDIIIRVGNLKNNERYYHQALGTCPIYLCASPELLSKYKTITRLEQVIQLPAIGYQHTRLQSEWNTGSKNGKVPLNITMIANTAEVMLQACLSSIGVALLPNFICKNQLANGTLIALFPEISESLPREIFCLYKMPRHQSLKIDLFLKKLQNWFSNEMHN